jgi:DNA invertase Pin-like site-specific DNA recombinase
LVILKDAAFHILFRRGASPVFIDRLKHPDDECPILQCLIEEVKQGDIIYVWALKSLGNTFDKLSSIIKQAEVKGVEFLLIKDEIDSTLLTDIKISDVIALYRKITFTFKSEDTLIGLDKARKAGVIGGRPVLEGTEQKTIAAERLYLNTELPIDNICQALQISKPTFYKYLKKRGIKLKS